MSSAWRSSFSIQRGTVDAEPLEELQGLERTADREAEHDRHRLEVLRGALVVVVGDQVLGRVDVVDDLGDEEGAARGLLRDQPEVLVALARVSLGDRDPAERQLRLHLVAQLVGSGERGEDRLLARGGPDEHRRAPGTGPAPPTRSGNDPLGTCPPRGRRWRGPPAGEITGEIVGGVHRRQERERALVGIAVAFVVDVVEDEAVDRQRPQPLQGDPGDLRGLLRARRQSRRRHREEQELARPSSDAPLQIHARNRSRGPSGRLTRWRQIHPPEPICGGGLILRGPRLNDEILP